MNNYAKERKAGHVGSFVCLHENTIDEHETKEGYYVLEGKVRPCLILKGQRKGYLLVWRLSGDAKTARFVKLRSLRRYDGKSSPSYLRNEYPNEVCFTHQRLARDLIGEIDNMELEFLLSKWEARNGFGPPM